LSRLIIKPDQIASYTCKKSRVASQRLLHRERRIRKKKLIPVIPRKGGFSRSPISDKDGSLTKIDP